MALCNICLTPCNFDRFDDRNRLDNLNNRVLLSAKVGAPARRGINYVLMEKVLSSFPG